MKVVLGALVTLSLLSGCSTTRYYEREKLAAHCMQLDADGTILYLRNKAESAREGAIGGFGGSSVGGCGCQ